MLDLVQPHVAATADDENELLALVVIRAAARCSGRETEEMRLHGCGTEGEQLEVDAGLARELDPLGWPDELAGLLFASKERKHVGVVEDRQPLQCGNRSVRLSTLKTAQEAYREVSTFCRLRERH